MTTLDQAIQHQIDLERYKTGLENRLSKSLDDLIDNIVSELSKLDTNITSARKSLVIINGMIDDTFSTIELDLLEELKEFLLTAVDWIEKYDSDVDKVEDRDALVGTLISSLILGNTMGDWLRSIKNRMKLNIRGNILNSIANNSSQKDIISSVRGTRVRGFKDSVLNGSKNHISTIANTAVQTLSSKTKMHLWGKQSSSQYIWISVLDSRTSPICRSRSNKIYKVGNGPIPPAHPRCRSIIMKYTKGLEVPESYSEWLKKQPTDVVSDILGNYKAKLFMSGKVSLDRFTTERGRELTIDELKRKLK